MSKRGCSEPALAAERRLAAIGDLVPEFDLSVYLNHPGNADLRTLDETSARRHYREHGEDEGRICSAVDSRAAFVSLVPRNATVLEIGPFFTPAFRRPGHDVRYLDILSTAELRARAQHVEGAGPEQVPDIDFVWTGQSYSSLTGLRKFDVVFSSHNVEHQPCLVEHLYQVASVLAPGGRFYAVIPDKRYCFDHFMPESSVIELLDAFLARRRRHLYKHVLEYRFLRAHNDPERHWAGDHGDRPAIASGDSEQMGRLAAAARELAATAEYLDTHAWRFTPRRFRETVTVLEQTGLIAFTVDRIYPTVKGSNEFYVVLGSVVPADFDPERYLALNPDVRGADPVRHWLEFGRREGRKWR